MPEVNIRESSSGDIDSILKLVPELAPLNIHTPYTYWNLFSNFGRSCFVAVIQDKAVGFVTSHPTDRIDASWFIWQIGIAQEYRGLGVADALLDNVVDRARMVGAQALRMTIGTDNFRSYQLFERLAARLGVEFEADPDAMCLPPVATGEHAEACYRISLNNC